MSYNDYMYAIDRSDEYLAHYGIKGMRWGVRKAKESGNSRALDRAYRKAAKKLAKLEKRSNNGARYAKRAAALGAGAAAAGTLAAVGTGGVASGIHQIREGAIRAATGLGTPMRNLGANARKAAMNIPNGKIRSLAIRGSNAVTRAGKALETSAPAIRKAGMTAGNAVSQWGKSNSIGSNFAQKHMQNNLYKNLQANKDMVSNAKLHGVMKTDPMGNLSPAGRKVAGLTNNDIARVGAGLAAAGLAAGAGYNAYRAATTKRAAQKAQEWRSEMNKAFKGTKYDTSRSSGGSRKRRRNRG